MKKLIMADEKYTSGANAGPTTYTRLMRSEYCSWRRGGVGGGVELRPCGAEPLLAPIPLGQTTRDRRRDIATFCPPPPYPASKSPNTTQFA